jgi:hypothetical protein
MGEKDPVVPRTIPGFLRLVLRRIMERRKWWLLPLWVVLVVLGILILLSGGSYLLPAIYIAF